MQRMFHSATLKLTGWYLLIIMAISITFSGALYQFAMGELSARFDSVQSELEETRISGIPSGFIAQLRLAEGREAARSLTAGLIYVNLLILFGGGLGSYLLARRTLQPIEEANDAQSRFVADASHQLRTPLANMKVELETALRGPKLSNQESTELIKSTLEEVDTLANLSHRLLDLSRLDDPSNTLPSTAFSLSELAKTTISRSPKAVKRIDQKISGKLMVRANRPSIEELLNILIDNAVKYSPPKSQIKLTLKRSGREAILRISNEGEGIADSELPRIFDRFYRSNQSKRANGYGLGLSLAKRIVESARGELEVSSQPGELTTFTVKLPLVSLNRLKN